MEWLDFVEIVDREIAKGDLFSQFRLPLKNEQALTRHLGNGLRRPVASCYELRTDSAELFSSVTYRAGDTRKDRLAYANARDDRWVFFHDVFFAPDILISRTYNKTRKILPIEVKLISAKSPSQSFATAIGQLLVYAAQFGQTIAVLGVLRSAKWGKYRFRIEANGREETFYEGLAARGVRVIIREVGL